LEAGAGYVEADVQITRLEDDVLQSTFPDLFVRLLQGRG
jgi:hypothetical protein